MRLIRKNVERVAVTEAQIEKLKAQGFRPIGGDAAEADQADVDINSGGIKSHCQRKRD